MVGWGGMRALGAGPPFKPPSNHRNRTTNNTTNYDDNTTTTPKQVYPDYDFSQLRAHHFKKEAGIAKVEEVAEACLLEVGKAWEATPGGGEAPFLDALWRALDEVRGAARG